jgi:hypothetical protein
VGLEGRVSTRRAERYNPNSCFNKAADDEPLFVLRAQDVLAPGLVRLWCAMVIRAHMETGNPDAAPADKPLPTEKLSEALKLALRMEAWQAEHTPKIPD